MKMATILSEVCDTYGVSKAEIMGCHRYEYVVLPRHIFMYRSMKAGKTSGQVGRFLGKNSSTIRHGTISISSKLRRGELEIQ